jgi:hypothetical protein
MSNAAPFIDYQEMNVAAMPRDCVRGGVEYRISPRDRSRGAFCAYDIVFLTLNKQGVLHRSLDGQ